MHTLPEAFNLATFIGLWEPLDWRSHGTKKLYKIYTCFTLFVMTCCLIIQFGAILFYAKTINEFVESIYMLLSTINAFVKGITIIVKRDHVIKLANTLKQDVCLPLNSNEKSLYDSFNKMSRYTVFVCIILAESTIWCLATWPLLLAKNQHVLPLMAWYPYNVTSDLAYWLSYLHQALALGLTAAYDVANDCIITGFMIQACAQLELLTLRLNVLTRRLPMFDSNLDVSQKIEKKMITNIVQHHLLIFDFANKINAIFAPVIGVQFCISSIVLCTTIYQLAFKRTNGIELIFLILYLISMLVEFFIYCYFGNEISLKSKELVRAIWLETDWVNLRLQTIKSFIPIMVRSNHPIVINCGPLITLSLDSFAKMVKLSYTAFNILQRST